MRVCFFNRSYYPDLAATGQLLTELAEDLVRDYGFEVSVVVGPPLSTGSEDGVYIPRWIPFRRERRNGVEIFRAGGTTFEPRRLISRTANYLSYFLTACLAGLRVPRPDVVVSLTDPPIVGLAALLAARRAGARFVFLCQDVFPEVTRLLEGFHNETVVRLLDRITRFLIQRADRVVALGDTMWMRLVAEKGADPKKVIVIHNWADCTAITPGQKRNSFSLAHGLSDVFVVMHSGNVGLSQNLETLLDAADGLRHCPNLVVAVIGDGARRAALEARAKAHGLANIRFLPYQPKERLAESFATADVFVVSLRTNLAGYIVPSKLYGILAAGRPYVAAVEASCEVAAITRKHNCGLLATPNDPADLAEKILTLYHDRELARRLGTNARQAALEFDRPVQVRAYHDLLCELNHVALRARRPPLMKRPFDVILSGLGIVLSAPLWGLIALGIALEDRGPVFFGQERVGKGGVRFKSWKFRSMIPDSDGKSALLQARDGDSRVTRIGRFLRATALDELPQLWNILRGDMSFVGPRALLPAEIEVNGSAELVPLERIPGYEARHQVRPGLTGLAQVYAPRDLLRSHKFKFDLLYIKRQAFWLDLKLLALSFWITIRGKWGSRNKKV